MDQPLRTDALSRKTLLVVDDEPGLAELTAFRLREAGVTCETATSAAEALTIIEGKSVDIVLTDVRMPKTDGVALLKTIASLRGASIAVILMSGFPDLTDEQVTELGAFALLSKPIPFDKLLSTLNAAAECVQRHS